MRRFRKIIIRAKRRLKALLSYRFRPNLAVWRSWEQSSRAAGLALVGLSMYATGGSVNPASLAVGLAFLVLNVYIARRLGQAEEERS